MVACFFMTESHAQNKGNSLNLASQLTMSKTIRRTIDPKVLKGHPPLNKSPRAIMEPRMGGREPRMGTNGHEWGGGNYETHEWHERIIQRTSFHRMIYSAVSAQAAAENGVFTRLSTRDRNTMPDDRKTRHRQYPEKTIRHPHRSRMLFRAKVTRKLFFTGKTPKGTISSVC